MLNFLTIIAAAAPEMEATGNPIQAIANQFHVDWPFLIAQIINFCIVATLLYKFAFKPVVATLDERQKKIQDGLQYAEEMKSRLADAEKQHAETLKKAAEEATQLVNEARDNAKAYYDKQTQEAAAKASDIVKKAEQAMEQERKQMISEVRKEVAQLVVQTTSKVLGSELNESDRSRYSEAAAKQLYGNN